MVLLENEVVLLRAMEPEDLDVLYKWENDTNLWCCGSTLAPYSRFALRDYLLRSTQDIFSARQLRLMIVGKETNVLMGTVDLYDFDLVNLRAGIGILIDTVYRRQGIGYQSLQLLEEYAFLYLSLKQLYAYIPANNLASYQLFRKSGYKESGFLESWIKASGSFMNVHFMQLINRNF